MGDGNGEEFGQLETLRAGGWVEQKATGSLPVRVFAFESSSVYRPGGGGLNEET